MASCCTNVDIIAAMAVHAERPDEVVSTSGRSIVMRGVSSSHEDMAILANLGGCICFHAGGLPQGVFTCCIKIFGAPVCWPGIVGVEAVTVAGMMRHLEHPRKGMVEMEPQGWALWYLLLHSLVDSGPSSSATSEHWEGVTITQGDGGSLERTSSSMKLVNGPMHLLNSLTHSANWHGSPSGRGLAILAQCCRAFAEARVLLGCFN